MDLYGSRPAFVGRTQELALLFGALADARGARPQVVLIYGEAGVGKSALLTELGARAAGQGSRVLVGGSPPMIGGRLPYAPFVGAFGELLSMSLTAAEEATSPARVLEAVLDALSSVGAEHGAVVVLEDLHWADVSTLDLLAALVRMLRAERVLIAGSVRTGDLDADAARALTELARHARVHRVDLPRFTRAEVAGLMTSITGDPPGETELDWMLQRSGGNAFFAEQLIAAGGAHVSVPTVLRDLILARLVALSDAERDVLRLAAAAGVDVEHEVLERSCSLREAELDRVLRVLRDADLLFPNPETQSYSFPHALVREVVEEDTLPGERLRMHAALGRALDGSPDAGGLGRAAGHWDAAGDHPRALASAVVAGRAAAAVGAPAEASQWYERARSLWSGVTGPELVARCSRSQLLACAGEAAALAGNLGLAVARLDEAVDVTDDAVEAAVLHSRRGHVLQMQGRRHEAVAAARLGAQLIGDRRVPDRVQVLAELARCSFLAGMRDAVSDADDAVELARLLGSPLELGTALTVRGLVSIFHDPAAAAETLQQARAYLPARPETGETRWRVHHALCVLSVFDARWNDAIEVGLNGDALAKELGLARSMGASTLSVVANALFWSARWDECERLLGEALRRGPVDRSESHLRLRRSYLLGAQGRVEEASDNACMLVQLHQEEDLQDALWLAHILADLELSRGDAHRALEIVTRALEQHSAEHVFEAMGLLLWTGVTAAAELGDAPTAAALAGSARAIGGRGLRHLRLLDAVLQLTDLEAARAAGEDTPSAWSSVAVTFDGIGSSLPAAYCRYHQARSMLTRQGDRREAAATLAVARTTAIGLSAEPLLAKIDDLARRSRVDLRRAATARPSHGLSNRELEVLALVRDGHTNPEIAAALFISRKTASHHVSSILAKLGVHTRRQAAERARRLGVGSPDDPSP